MERDAVLSLKKRITPDAIVSGFFNLFKRLFQKAQNEYELMDNFIGLVF